jgi:hypothetical protein
LTLDPLFFAGFAEDSVYFGGAGMPMTPAQKVGLVARVTV